MAATPTDTSAVLAPLAPAAAPAEQPWWLRVLAHLAVGVGISVLVGLFISLLFGDGLLRNLVYSLCIGACIQGLIELGRYGISALLRRRGLRNERLAAHWPGWPLMGPYVLLAALAGYAIGRQVSAWLLGEPPPVYTSLRPLVLVLVVTMAVSIAATYHFYARSELAKSAARAQAAQHLAGESQLRLLQTQLEPHMLFNTLANLRVLVGLDPPRAQLMLDHLIRYLRATLGASHARLHPLAQEFALLGDYLALMALRMGPRLQVQLDLPDDLAQRQVPPLLLQPLVENGIHHGLEPKIEGGRLHIQARHEADHLVLRVRDTGLGLAGPGGPVQAPPPPGADPGPPAATGGYGSRHVAARLAVLYGPQARLLLLPASDAEGGTLAEVQIPFAATA